MEFESGRVGELSRVVDEAMTASAIGSGLVAGLATPVMIALMEGAAVEAVRPVLDEKGLSSVGTRIDVEHLAPTPVGMRVTARATLEAVDGRRLVFRVAVEDEAGLIGRGTHERFVVDLESFTRKLAARGAQRG